jgi:type IV secretory pathway TrbF-like protein
MTNSDSLKSVISGYTLSDNAITRICTDRGITASGTYAGKDESFELAMADVYVTVANMVNVSEGGYSVSMSERERLLKEADAIYAKWQDGATAAGIPNIRNKSELW